jgi:hypothetical protein
VPNAYNLGLANGQTSFPSMADFGSFQSFGIRYPRTSWLTPPNNDGYQPQPLLLPRDALASTDSDSTDSREAIPRQGEEENPAQEQIDSDSEPMLSTIPLVSHAATEDINAVQAATRNRRAAVERTFPEPGAATEVQGEQVADEQPLPIATMTLPQRYGLEENVFASEESAEPADERPFLDSDLVHDVPALESLNLPGTLLLTVLTPAQLMVLMAEFPVAAVPSERGEEIAEYNEFA